MKFVYIASPLRADSSEEMAKNRQLAVEYCKEAMQFSALSCETIVPISPILNFPYLDGNNDKEREMALNMGLALLSKADEIWVAGDKITEGMKGELIAACRMNIPILSMKMPQEKIVEAIGKLPPLFDSSHCVKNSKEMDFTKQLLILKPEALNPWHVSQENMLWVCSHGNGVRPTAIGRSVFVENLVDGEKGRWDRNDFYGIGDLSKLPSWVAEKWQERQQKDVFNDEISNETSEENEEMEA